MAHSPNTVKMIQAVEACIEVADELYGTSLKDSNVRIRFDLRGYRVPGQAGGTRNRYTKEVRDLYLRFHPEAVEQHLDYMVSVVIPHEVAHLVNYADGSTGNNHDRGWKQVCLALGGTGERTHSLNFGNAPTKEEREAKWEARRPYVYIDDKGVERRITKQRHNAIQNGKVSKRGGFGHVVFPTYIYSDNKGKIGPDSKWHYDPIMKVAINNNKKTSTKRKAPQARKGGPSKADVCRRLIKEFYGKIDDNILIDKIAHEAKLSKSLAKKYFNNNLAKVFA